VTYFFHTTGLFLYPREGYHFLCLNEIPDVFIYRFSSLYSGSMHENPESTDNHFLPPKHCCWFYNSDIVSECYNLIKPHQEYRDSFGRMTSIWLYYSRYSWTMLILPEYWSKNMVSFVFKFSWAASGVKSVTSIN